MTTYKITRGEDEYSILVYKTMIGTQVIKKSKNPFKSGKRINTVSGIIEHPQTGAAAFTFEDDDSNVVCKICKSTCAM